MIITKTIAEAIIEKNKPFAPEKAKVILVHEDGRVIFAEKFEQGCKFWYSDNMRESTLQGIIHKLTLVAKRNDQGDWVALLDFSSKVTPVAPKSRHDRILEQQEKLNSARAGKKPPVVPAASEPKKKGEITRTASKQYSHYVETPNPPQGLSVVDPVKTIAAVEITPESAAFGADEFMSIRELEPMTRRRIASELFVSFRPDGKIILCKALRDTLTWTTLNMMVSRNFKRFAIMQGKEFTANQSGTYVNRALCAKLTFPEDAGTIRAVLEWDDNLNAYVGSIG